MTQDDHPEFVEMGRMVYPSERRSWGKTNSRHKPLVIWRPIPIGDLVEKWLTALGITKERVEKLTRTEGKPGGCGCEGRKRWLNEVGNKVQTDARNALIAAKKFYVGD
jgi:hypothetical protein